MTESNRPEIPDVTDAELLVLRALWEQGESTIREVSLRVYGDESPASYGTVQKLFERLERKGIVLRDRGRTPHRFRARLDRDALVSARLRAMAERFCEGSLTPLLTGLVGQAGLSSEDEASLRALIERLDAGAEAGSDGDEPEEQA
jgi:BlaI family penicillinase repressor